MKRKFLEDLELEKDVIDKIMAENGKDIESAKGDSETLKAEKESLEKQLSERDKQLEDLKKTSGDAEALKEQIEKLQADNKSMTEAHAVEVKKLKLDAAVDSALTNAGAMNNLAVKALLKDLDKAEIGEDGTIKGLKEQIEGLKKSDAYLFSEKDNKNVQVKGAQPGQSGDPSQTGDVKKMTYSQMVDYLAQNPGATIE